MINLKIKLIILIFQPKEIRKFIVYFLDIIKKLKLKKTNFKSNK